MGQNLRRRYFFEQFPVNRNEAPRRERGDAGDERGSLVRFVRVSSQDRKASLVLRLARQIRKERDELVVATDR